MAYHKDNSKKPKAISDLVNTALAMTRPTALSIFRLTTNIPIQWKLGQLINFTNKQAKKS